MLIKLYISMLIKFLKQIRRFWWILFRRATNSERSILSGMLDQSELDADDSKHNNTTQLTFMLPLLKNKVSH